MRFCSCLTLAADAAPLPTIGVKGGMETIAGAGIDADSPTDGAEEARLPAPTLCSILMPLAPVAPVVVPLVPPIDAELEFMCINS